MPLVDLFDGPMPLEADALQHEARVLDNRTRRIRTAAREGVIDFSGTDLQGRRMGWLDATQPIFDRYHESWERNETRLRGGEDVLDELRRFDWESLFPAPGDTQTAYETRRSRATYINFADMYATTVVGHLMRQAPKPGEGLSFGNLGEVSRERNFQVPSRAELIYYNADGVGNDGSQWDNFWAGAMKRAMATGHRWIMVERPRRRGETFADELAGARPYLVEFGPSSVPYWIYQEGVLQGAIIRVPDENPRIDSRGKMLGMDGREGYLLLVRSGYSGFGTDFMDGGWWLFDYRKQLKDEGNWAATRGEIPMCPLFYERDPGTRKRPGFSRGGLTELGSLGVSYMDAASARLFDAWDAAKSLLLVLGADRAGFNLMTDKMNEGAQVVPVPIAVEGNMGTTPVVPTIADGSMGAVPAQVFESLELSMLRAAERIGIQEASSVPDSSGLSKQAGWNENKSPRMALAASNLEGAQNIIIHFLELRWGFVSPKGSTRWTRVFDLIELVDKITGLFTLERLAGIRSKTLQAKLMVAAADDRGFISDDAEREMIRGEYAESAQMVSDQQAALATMGADAGTDLGAE